MARNWTLKDEEELSVMWERYQNKHIPGEFDYMVCDYFNRTHDAIRNRRVALGLYLGERSRPAPNKAVKHKVMYCPDDMTHLARSVSWQT